MIEPHRCSGPVALPLKWSAYHILSCNELWLFAFVVSLLFLMLYLPRADTMGAGRKTQTISAHENVPRSTVSGNGCFSARNLRAEDLCGVIFGCTHETMAECLSKQLFGLFLQFVYSYIFGRPLTLYMSTYVISCFLPLQIHIYIYSCVSIFLPLYSFLMGSWICICNLRIFKKQSHSTLKNYGYQMDFIDNKNNYS